jgi:pimeloyl-ACP methyl ester carboxylesterase
LLIEAGNSVTPAGQMREMKETGHRATYLHVPGAGHLVHDDAPREFRDAVEAFLTAFATRA